MPPTPTQNPTATLDNKIINLNRIIVMTHKNFKISENFFFLKLVSIFEL